MSTLQNFGVPLGGAKGRAGILMPCRAHRFRVSVHHRDNFETRADFMAEVSSVSYNLATKRIEIELRDDCLGGATAHLMGSAESRDLTVIIDPLDGGNDRATHTKLFTGCKLVDHASGFDYSQGETVMHKIVLSYLKAQVIRASEKGASEA